MVCRGPFVGFGTRRTGCWLGAWAIRNVGAAADVTELGLRTCGHDCPHGTAASFEGRLMEIKAG